MQYTSQQRHWNHITESSCVQQDYAEFFDALEHEELYECLGLDIPEIEEVEYLKKYKPEEKV